MKKNQLGSFVITCIFIFSCSGNEENGSNEKHQYNGSYTGEYLNRIAFPVDGKPFIDVKYGEIPVKKFISL